MGAPKPYPNWTRLAEADASLETHPFHGRCRDLKHVLRVHLEAGTLAAPGSSRVPLALHHGAVPVPEMDHRG